MKFSIFACLALACPQLSAFVVLAGPRLSSRGRRSRHQPTTTTVLTVVPVDSAVVGAVVDYGPAATTIVSTVVGVLGCGFGLTTVLSNASVKNAEKVKEANQELETANKASFNEVKELIEGMKTENKANFMEVNQEMEAAIASNKDSLKALLETRFNTLDASDTSNKDSLETSITAVASQAEAADKATTALLETRFSTLDASDTSNTKILESSIKAVEALLESNKKVADLRFDAHDVSLADVLAFIANHPINGGGPPFGAPPPPTPPTQSPP
jgi:hypothetical protein